MVSNATGNFRLPRHEVVKTVLAQGFRGAGVGVEVTNESGAASQHWRADVLISGDIEDARLAFDVSIARVVTSNNTNDVPGSTQELLAQTRGDLQYI